MPDDFPFHAHYVSISGLRLHYLDEGRPDGRPVLLLHGNPTWSYLYRRIIPPVAAAGYRVLALDNMGFGRSEKPPEVAAHSARRHVDNLRGFIEALDLRQLVLVGHGWGGFFALAYAVANPGNVAGLVMINSDTYMQFKAPREFYLTMLPGVGQFLVRRLSYGLNRLLRRGVVRTGSLTRQVMARYREPFPDYASRAGIMALPRMIPLQPGHPTYAMARDIEGGLRELKVPVLFVAGRQDPTHCADVARRLHEVLPASQLHIIENAAHFVQEEAPEELSARILAFLDTYAISSNPLHEPRSV